MPGIMLDDRREQRAGFVQTSASMKLDGAMEYGLPWVFICGLGRFTHSSWGWRAPRVSTRSFDISIDLSASPACSNALCQSLGHFWRKRRAVGYHGLSVRWRSHTQ